MSSKHAHAVGLVHQHGKIEKLYISLQALFAHLLNTGATGSGKSAHLIGQLLSVITNYKWIKMVLVDPKGETAQWLRDVFFPVLAQRFPHINPQRILTIHAFGRYGLRLNPLYPLPGVAVEVQATLVVGMIAGLLPDGLGSRATAILGWLVRAAILIKGTLLDCLAMLTDESVRSGIAERVSDLEVRSYLLFTFEHEPAASIQSLRSRLEWILLLPQVRAMLCATGCIAGSALLEKGLTICDLSGAPQGFAPLAWFFGGILFNLISGAIFNRVVTEQTPQCIVAIDEWQEVVRFAADDLERLLTLARFKKVSLYLVNQNLAQIRKVSPALLEIVLHNIGLHVAFRPDVTELKHLQPLLPITGRKIDPKRLDRLLSEDEERRAYIKRLATLPPRYALVGDFIAGTSHIIRTLSVPFDEARKRAAQLSPDTLEAFYRGSAGIPMGQLLAEAKRGVMVIPPKKVEGDALTTVSSSKGASPKRSNRPKLELP